ncbi:hypothetical protein MP228_012384 [Amoeboaphelidium protococcarum]|nr:hypothetical protein MP228_012384 [Amoeboaphelidium protococcarum]
MATTMITQWRSQLQQRGYFTIRDMSVLKPFHIQLELNVDSREADCIYSCIQEELKNSNTKPTITVFKDTCIALNNCFVSELPPLVRIEGCAKSGKTTSILTIIHSFLLQQQNGRVLWLNCDNSFSLMRLASMADATCKDGDTATERMYSLMKRVELVHISNCTQLLASLHLLKSQGVNKEKQRIVVIDGLEALFRPLLQKFTTTQMVIQAMIRDLPQLIGNNIQCCIVSSRPFEIIGNPKSNRKHSLSIDRGAASLSAQWRDLFHLKIDLLYTDDGGRSMYINNQQKSFQISNQGVIL